MAKDTLLLISLIFSLNCVTKISSSYAQPALTEYLLRTLGQHGPPVPSPPSPSKPPLRYPNPGYGQSYQNYQTPNIYPNLPKPSSPMPGSLPLTAITNLAAAIPVSGPKPKTPSVPKVTDLPPAPFDSNVLNNLAIALQLLIVSNILNTPADNTPENKFDFSKFEPTPKYETLPISPLTLSYPVKPALQSSPYLESPVRSIYSYESLLPNSKFVGSSGFVEPSMFGSALTSASPRPNPRSSMTLMSPYEALEPNSPFSDPVLSSVYGSSYSKKDFQSPYASILAADGQKDLFSMSDLF